MSQHFDRIQVDPSQLDGFLDDFDEGPPETGQSCVFHHDVDWVAKVCEQIKNHRFALIHLPRRFEWLYKTLVQPQSYPCVLHDGVSVKEQAKTANTNMNLIPEKLDKLSAAWAQVCEHVCKVVTRKLLLLTTKCPTFSHEELHGALRISYNSTAGPHFDNAYVTMMGTGNVKGGLQFGLVHSSTDSADERDDDTGVKLNNGNEFAPCEDFFDAFEPDEKVTFLVFAGVRIASPLAEHYKPLLHRVQYTAEECSMVDRINTIYFLRRYDLGDRDIAKTHYEIHAFNQTFVNQQNWLDSDPTPAVCFGSENDKTSDAGASGHLEDAEEPEEGVFDWNYTGLPPVRAD
ncbi:unnamed protein product [Polarella glacialis]|uniref:Fe2OG dioxygenase domain-containing protein n=1 Tax=Polarella glacialis TaxID=89957 RepID=A0A813FNF5_POLGL|nr:unnamed protein product [Polarella glacialis]CAE8672197.1 unnamed protein product [Polarella glacialis]